MFTATCHFAILATVFCCLFLQSFTFHATSHMKSITMQRSSDGKMRQLQKSALFSSTKNDNNINNNVDAVATTTPTTTQESALSDSMLALLKEAEEEVKEETPEEKYKRELLAEIAEDKAKEVFMKRNTGKYECQACGYVYDETKGIAKRGIQAGTPFETIEKFRCPQCGASRKYFVAETETLSGFKENLNYGLGTNGLTAGQKSLLIYGGLLAGVAVFLSGYLME